MGGALDPAVAEVRLAVRTALHDLDPGARLLVACSGGADSLALAAATVFEARHAGWVVSGVVVDHGLQDGSGEVSAEVAARLTAIGCEPVEVVRVTVGREGGPEAAARRARYAALEDTARRQDALVLLGHTLDDQAETVLLGLARGSGTRSLAGMTPASDWFRRPLLGVRREHTRQACRAEGLTVWDDPHNADRAFARVRVRREALPVLEATLGPGVTEALARTATAARADADLLDELASSLLAEATGASGAAGTAPAAGGAGAAGANNADGGLDVAVLAAAPGPLRRRALRSAALAAGCPARDLFAVHVDELERLVDAWHGQGPLTLPGGVEARRTRGTIRLAPAAVSG